VVRCSQGFGNILLPTNGIFHSAIDFFNTVKYPPTIAYTLLTFAVFHLLYAVLYLVPTSVDAPGLGGWFRRSICPLLLDLGASALFFFCVHHWMLFLIARVMPLFTSFGQHQLWQMYVMWVVVLLLNWPLCKWWARFKSTQSEESLWRML
jgi:hypothetical protein